MALNRYNWVIDFTHLHASELQITFKVKGYLPPGFELNADFQNISGIFTPIFFLMLKIDDITVFQRSMHFYVV